jgi:hypothetical protein
LKFFRKNIAKLETIPIFAPAFESDSVLEINIAP